ncbi:MAG: cyclophilin-like fold protein [Candidatus Izemoplasmatales bacterium]|nr:cyclophilin-like fold protein [Candidatus Izemoplasmatales bacterium]
MKNIIILIIGLVMMISLTSCGSKTNNTISTIDDNPSIIPSDTTQSDNTSTEDDELMNKAIVFKIGNTEVDVYWLDNDSVKALKNLAKDGLTINMSKYGGFEQVGSIGSTMPSSDTRITTNPGDIVLYSSNQIVIFYDSNTWSYTKLGHINLSKSELIDLLGDEDVVITLSLE